jgi:hypothetical protein
MFLLLNRLRPLAFKGIRGEDASRLVSDEPVIVLPAQADCPRVIDIFTAILF